MAYGVLVDPEDKIVPSFTTVTADEWLTLLLLGVMGLVGFFALTRYRLFTNNTSDRQAMFQVLTADTSHYCGSAAGHGDCPGLWCASCGARGG